MSLTVASAALDTAWAEFGAVALTTSTLANLSACIEQVEVKLKRGTLSATSTPTDTQVGEWIIRAKQELADTKQFSFKRRYVTCTLTAGTYRYAMPPDYAGGRLSIRDITNNRIIRVTSAHQFDILYPDPSEEAGTSGGIVAAIKNMELWVMPPPGDDVIELDYQRSGDDVTATDISWLPEMARWWCCDFGTAEAFMSLHQFDIAQFYLARWEAGLKKISRGDGKKRWSAMGYRARSIFQA